MQTKQTCVAIHGRAFLFTLFILILVAGLIVAETESANNPKAKGKVKYALKVTGGPEISVNRSQLNFGAIKEGAHSTSSATHYQTLLIGNSGGGTLNWEIGTSDDWLICHPTHGTNSGSVKVYVAACPLPPGSYKGTLTVEDSNATNSPQTISVLLNVYSPPQDSPPFGSFETPVHNSTVSSSIPVTGWALDDVEVDNVKIYNGSSYVGDAVFVEGARPDVAQAYPDYPLNYKAGWGYMMLTNFLPGGGNGTYHIKAIATDSEGNSTTLGTKTILVDNEHAVKPFGAIDTPTQGGTASGSSYINWGWALTPQPKHIPTDGSTINVFIDGQNEGHPHYNNYRKDIATKFPDLANKDGAVGYFYFDTTGYADGVHTIQWTATDNEGRTDGIGSRYFTIDNTNGSDVSPFHLAETTDLSNLVANPSNPVFLSKGFNTRALPVELYSDLKGNIDFCIRELEPLQIKFPEGYKIVAAGLVSANKIHQMPVGSAVDYEKGTINWMPGLAYQGLYTLGVVAKDIDGNISKNLFNIRIKPKFDIKR
jgi:hypothetical protein